MSALVCLAGCPGDDQPGDDGDTGSESGSGSDTGDSDTGDSDTGEAPDPNLVEVPGGTFEMGCGANDSDCDADNPAHSVTVSSFWMEITEVTTMSYEACVDAGACTPAGEGGDCNYGLGTTLGNRQQHPINCVTWQQAVDYCSWKGRRLPTEAEWEYAARGSDGRPFPWGSAPATCELAHMFETVDMMGNYGCQTGITAPVGSYPDGASPFGMMDMAGNVEEWVADWYAADYYPMSPAADPSGPASGSSRGHRGGDLLDASGNNLRTFERWKSMPDQPGTERGFRCAADP